MNVIICDFGTRTCGALDAFSVIYVLVSFAECARPASRHCAKLGFKMAEGDAAAGNPNQDFGEIDLTWMDKIRKMVSSDAEWEAIILKKMEEKRNREMGIETAEEPANFSVGGIFNKIKSYIPARKPDVWAGASSQTAEAKAPEMDRMGDELMESQ